MTVGGTVFNRRMSAIYPPTWPNISLPLTDGDYDGFSDPWEEEIITEGTEEWRKASTLINSVTRLAEWLEEDLPARFAKLLDFILPRLPEPTTQQEENDDDC